MRTVISALLTGFLAICLWIGCLPVGLRAAELRIATFSADITPPVGKPVGLGFVPYAKTVEHPLMAKGMVLKDAGGTYVLCALDWMEVHNDSYDFLRREIATAAGTSASRVALHCLHQHTAPAIDSAAQRLQLDKEDPRRIATQNYLHETARRIALRIRKARGRMVSITEVGTSKAQVERVASSRRIRQKDGTILARLSSTRDLKLQAAPVGTIDPWLRTLSLGRAGKPVVQIHVYATHPQSFYGDARLSYDTVGIARERLQKETGVFQIYLTGCAGDIAMGKYNDGSREARKQLTDRIYDAMKRSVAHLQRQPITPIRWRTIGLRFPPRKDAAFSEQSSREILNNPKSAFSRRLKAAINLAWIARTRAGHPVECSCLTIGTAQLLNLPGEPFVQYQLAAQRFRPTAFVLAAGYTDCGMGYIGGDRIYTDRGGYEQSYAFAGPCEALMLKTIKRLLAAAASDSDRRPSSR